jgi:hypothetical protein
MKKLLYLISVGISANTYAVGLDLQVAPGYDDNPYHLSDSFNSDGGWFVDTEVKAKHYINDFRLRGKLSHRSYEGNADDADATVIKLDGRYKKEYKIGDKKAFSHLIVNYADKNNTYVKRSTGDVATYKGKTIGNRFDYDVWGGEIKTAIYFTDALRGGLELNYLNKDYENLHISSLSNLDNEQITLSNDWNYALTDKTKLELVLSYSERDYDDKREKTLSGSSIKGSNLKYDFYTGVIALKHKVSEHFSTEFKVKYEEKRDSGPGYYDTDKFKVSAEIDYDFSDSLSFTAQAAYTDKDYVNKSVMYEDDGVHPTKDGYTLSAHIEKDLGKVSNLPMALFTGVQYEDYDSLDADFEYDRFLIFTGLEVGIK